MAFKLMPKYTMEPLIILPCSYYSSHLIRFITGNVDDGQKDYQKSDAGAKKIGSGQDEDDSEDCDEANAQGQGGVFPHGQVLLVEDVEDAVGKHVDLKTRGNRLWKHCLVKDTPMIDQMRWWCFSIEFN